MDSNYINVVAQNPYTTIVEIGELLTKRDSWMSDCNIAQDSSWKSHIIMQISGESEETISGLISHIEEISDVKEVRDMKEDRKEIRFLFNVNCNCKKTLKKISKKPDRVVETNKELIYVFLVKLAKKDMFLQELANLQLPYTKRIVGLTSN